MKTIYQHQFKLYQSHEGFFMASGHYLNDSPYKYELLPLPTPQFLPPGEKVKLEITANITSKPAEGMCEGICWYTDRVRSGRINGGRTMSDNAHKVNPRNPRYQCSQER